MSDNSGNTEGNSLSGTESPLTTASTEEKDEKPVPTTTDDDDDDVRSTLIVNRVPTFERQESSLTATNKPDPPSVIDHHIVDEKEGDNANNFHVVVDGQTTIPTRGTSTQHEGTTGENREINDDLPLVENSNNRQEEQQKEEINTPAIIPSMEEHQQQQQQQIKGDTSQLEDLFTNTKEAEVQDSADNAIGREKREAEAANDNNNNNVSSTNMAQHLHNLDRKESGQIDAPSSIVAAQSIKDAAIGVQIDSSSDSVSSLEHSETSPSDALAKKVAQMVESQKLLQPLADDAIDNEVLLANAITSQYDGSEVVSLPPVLPSLSNEMSQQRDITSHHIRKTSNGMPSVDENFPVLLDSNQHTLRMANTVIPTMQESSSLTTSAPSTMTAIDQVDYTRGFMAEQVAQYQPVMVAPSFTSYTRPAYVQQRQQQRESRGPPNNGRRKIFLRLEEEVMMKTPNQSTRTLLGHIRSRSKLMFGSNSLPTMEELNNTVQEKGNITLSWFDGTSSLELQDHVRNSIHRKLMLSSNTQIIDLRLLDTSVDPPEEIVLTPYIPTGSRFLVRFRTKDMSSDGTSSPMSTYSQTTTRPPESPSAAPSPHPTRKEGGLSMHQIALLRSRLNKLHVPATDRKNLIQDFQNASILRKSSSRDLLDDKQKEGQVDSNENRNVMNLQVMDEQNETGLDGIHDEHGDDLSIHSQDMYENDEDDMLLHSEDPIESHLRQITELLIQDRQRRSSKSGKRRAEKRQVVFVLANYFVLFLSLIAISAEIQARIPDWLAWIELQMRNVNSCAADKDALFKCVENGDFAGLIASVVLWLSRSVATRRIFLFGFDTPKKLWTIVYECLVTSACWGFSYLFVRRGLNPDTRTKFLQKYWKDAVYGSLAGFNAAFMKQVLKNLIPQEAVEDALRERHIKILSWLPSFT